MWQNLKIWEACMIHMRYLPQSTVRNMYLYLPIQDFCRILVSRWREVYGFWGVNFNFGPSLWNFKLKVLKYQRNFRPHATVISQFGETRNLHFKLWNINPDSLYSYSICKSDDHEFYTNLLNFWSKISWHSFLYSCIIYNSVIWNSGF